MAPCPSTYWIWIGAIPLRERLSMLLSDELLGSCDRGCTFGEVLLFWSFLERSEHLQQC